MDACRGTAGLGIWGWTGLLVPSLSPTPPAWQIDQGGAPRREGGQGCPGGWVGRETEEKEADEWVPPEGSWYRMEI
jgi:hypothetical protein